MQTDILNCWLAGNYQLEGQKPPRNAHPDLPWVEYESYMRAQVLRGVPGQLGELIIEFPPEGAEDNRLHVHPQSDRVITVISGSGTFVAVRLGKRITRDLRQGSRIYMPRGVLHTFFAGSNGLLVHAVHNPFVALDDPSILIYPNTEP